MVSLSHSQISQCGQERSFGSFLQSPENIGSDHYAVAEMLQL
jgi:hypothetical protein